MFSGEGCCTGFCRWLMARVMSRVAMKGLERCRSILSKWNWLWLSHAVWIEFVSYDFALQKSVQY
ncbi:hypothetical protein WG66_005748 [Moniliophthora roreri]|nr:hypothetical protein WG66_005748 [Moniliophthora roreri]